MASVFDDMAVSYDADFTDSPIGKIQREQVWKYLQPKLNGTSGLDILEINCGTGADAVKFAQMGHYVLATDVSEEMLKLASRKNNFPATVLSFKKMDIRNINEINGLKFDLVFSNFGGLNCLSEAELKALFDNLIPKMKPGSHFIAVVMPRYALFENFYFLFSLRFGKLFRRMKKSGDILKTKNHDLQVYYYNPSFFQMAMKARWEMAGKRPVGFAVPPSYLGKSVKRFPFILNFLKKADIFLSKMVVLSAFSDHYLIDLKYKG